jgi:hypothetical protein
MQRMGNGVNGDFLAGLYFRLWNRWLCVNYTGPCSFYSSKRQNNRLWPGHAIKEGAVCLICFFFTLTCILSGR